MNPQKEISEAGTLTKTDWKSIGKSFMLAALGGLALAIAGWLTNFDWSTIGKWGVYLAPLSPFVINFLEKWVTTHTNVVK